MTLSLKHTAFLVLILLFGFILRSHEALQMQDLEHDDQISLLAASGHLVAYDRLVASNQLDPQLHTAEYWQRLLQVDQNTSFLDTAAIISDDLQQRDIHPPLYFFWLNRVMAVVDGVPNYIGWLSNAPLFVLNTFLLFLLGRRLLGDTNQALLATLIWSLSTTAIEGSIVARHYEILTLFTLLSTLVLLPALDKTRLQPGGIIAYGVVAICGFLANYQFLYHLAALSLLILVAHRRRPGLVVLYGAVTLFTLGIALWLYPALLNQTREVADKHGIITQADVLFRLRNTIEEFAKYCIPGTLMLLWGMIWQRRQRSPVSHRLVVLVAINTLALAGAYLAFVAPRHAMGERYMASVGPFLSLLFATVLMQWWQRPAWRYSLLALLLIPALLLARNPGKSVAAPPQLQQADLVLADFDERGVWPGIFMQLTPQQPVLLAPQDYLLGSNNWQQHLPQGLIMWVSNPKSGHNSRSRQMQLLERLSATCDIAEVKTRDKGLNYFAGVCPRTLRNDQSASSTPPDNDRAESANTR